MERKKKKVCWISAGVSSFMAGYLSGDVDEWIYIDISDQHPDSIRFIKDCEKALGVTIKVVIKGIQFGRTVHQNRRNFQKPL